MSLLKDEGAQTNKLKARLPFKHCVSLVLFDIDKIERRAFYAYYEQTMIRITSTF